jgi:hypothetical protein
MRHKLIFLLMIMLCTKSYGQNVWGAKPDSAKYFTVVELDTIEAPHQELKPASFTYIRTYYYPHSTRTFKDVSGSYTDGLPSGAWVWFLAPAYPKSHECCQAGPGIYVNYTVDSVCIEPAHGGIQIVKHLKNDSLSGYISGWEFKPSRFSLANGRCTFLDLTKEELRYGHYNYLEQALWWYEWETGVELILATKKSLIPE